MQYIQLVRIHNYMFELRYVLLSFQGWQFANKTRWILDFVFLKLRIRIHILDYPADSADSDSIFFPNINTYYETPRPFLQLVLEV